MSSKGGGLGLEPTKNACLCKKMPSNIPKFGSANNFSGKIGERALKGIVKDHADKTRRRPDKFAEQCAIREYKKNVIKYVMTDMSNSIGASKSPAPR